MMNLKSSDSCYPFFRLQGKKKPGADISALLAKTANPSGKASEMPIPKKTVDRWDSRPKAPRSPSRTDELTSPESHRPRARARSRSRSPERFGFEEDDDPPDKGDSIYDFDLMTVFLC